MKLFKTRPTIVTQANHLADFETCPHCHQRREFKQWRTHLVAVCTAIIWGKHEDGVAIFECPKCFEKCWLHFHLNMSNHYDFPKNIRAAVDAEYSRRCLQAVREWPAGICWKCRHLQSADVSTHAWRNCIIGCGPPRTECNRFEALRLRVSALKS